MTTKGKSKKIAIKRVKYDLLTVNGDAKTVKGLKQGYLTGILYLSPATEGDGITNLCGGASEACIKACLHNEGRSRIFKAIKIARRRRTLAYLANFEAFVERLSLDIIRLDNGKSFELTTPQLTALREAAARPSGVFALVRRNETTENILATVGLLIEDFAYRSAEERQMKTEHALEHLHAAEDYATSGRFDKAEEAAEEAYRTLRSLHRTRLYLSEAAYAIVLEKFPQAVVFLPAQFQHLGTRSTL